MAARPLDRVTKQFVEHVPIGKLGQAVVRSEILDPLIGLGLFVGPLEILQGNDTLSASRCNSPANSGVKVSGSVDM